mgnify:FL=1|jgi:hypothetical protein
MAKRKKTISCARCGRIEKRCRRNPDTHIFCRHEDCVRERKRERQRKSQKRKYREDKVFAEAERKRCGENLKARRKKAETAEASEAKSEAHANLELVVLGMLGSLTDADDATAIRESLRLFERRGQRLAVFTPLARGAPSQNITKCSSTGVRG